MLSTLIGICGALVIGGWGAPVLNIFVLGLIHKKMDDVKYALGYMGLLLLVFALAMLTAGGVNLIVLAVAFIVSFCFCMLMWINLHRGQKPLNVK